MIKQKVIRRRSYKKFGFLGLGIFVMAFLFMFLSHNFGKTKDEAVAADFGKFQAGYIISDFQMTNYNSMSENDIQNWLTSKNSCNNRDHDYYQRLSAGSVYKWHFEDGHFICLSEERFGDNDDEIGFQYKETAAHIIWQAAQDYRINPRVLLVLLQKETGLITDPIPNNGDYRKATGYGCPDTAACSSKYYGFKNQIRNAAYLFRIVMDGDSSFYPIGNNYVQYNPNSGCGGSMVYIKNLATSALYRYTPYQPNAGALAAGYGTALCGAYGNRNFYAYFEDWFGGITDEGWPTVGEILSNNRVEKEDNDLAFTYQTHIQHYGWLDWVDGGVMSGTAGYKLRVEALAIKLGNNEKGIEYQTHVAKKGWLGYVKDGAVSGTVGESLQVEAVQIRLTGQIAKMYDVYYRTHVASIGWTEWVKNDEVSGTIGKSKQVEAVQIKLVKKEIENKLEYSAHVQTYGWMDWVEDGETAGTTGESKRLEALKIKFPEELADKDEIICRVHVQNIGWMEQAEGCELIGTEGKALRMEAIEIKLTGELAKKYDVCYRTHVQNYGWMKWSKNGEMAGTTGESLRIEAIEVKLVEK